MLRRILCPLKFGPRWSNCLLLCTLHCAGWQSQVGASGVPRLCGWGSVVTVAAGHCLFVLAVELLAATKPAVICAHNVAHCGHQAASQIGVDCARPLACPCCTPPESAARSADGEGCQLGRAAQHPNLGHGGCFLPLDHQMFCRVYLVLVLLSGGQPPTVTGMHCDWVYYLLRSLGGC